MVGKMYIFQRKTDRISNTVRYGQVIINH